MFKSALLYRIDHWDPPSLAEIESQLALAPFVECAPSERESAGWVGPRGDAQGALVEAVAGHWLLRLCSEAKAVPAGVIRRELAQRLDRIEKQTGHRPKGKVARTLKDEILFELLPRAFAKRAETPLWIDPEAGLALVGAASTKKADAVLTRLHEAMHGRLRLAPLQTRLAPATAMADWLASQDAPGGFTIDRDCELKQPEGEKAAVRYARHTLEIAELAEHIRQGKRPTRLALTWNGRVSFELTEGLALKKIKLLDLALEGPGAAAPADAGFDADAALFTGEMRLLIADLMLALGGLQQAGTAAGSEPASSVAPWEDAVPA